LCSCGQAFGAGEVLPRQKLGAADGAAKPPEASCGFTAMRSQCQRIGACWPPLTQLVK